MHLDTLAAVGADLALGRADGALISTARTQGEDVGRFAALIRDYPGLPVVGLVSGDETDAVHAALVLGQAGVGTVADVRERSGWAVLRTTFAAHACDPFVGNALAQIVQAIGAPSDGTEPHCTTECRRFFATVFEPQITISRQIAQELGVVYSTLLSRFDRAGLPSPKQYLGLARLVHAAHLAESPGLTISAIAFRLNASTPQAFNRTVGTMLGMSAGAFRRRFTGAAMLERFVATLITPYREILQAFDPITGRREGGLQGRGGVEGGRPQLLPPVRALALWTGGLPDVPADQP